MRRYAEFVFSIEDREEEGDAEGKIVLQKNRTKNRISGLWTASFMAGATSYPVFSGQDEAVADALAGEIAKRAGGKG